MKKILFALIAGIIITGCSSNGTANLEADYKHLDALDTGQSIVRGDLYEKVYVAEVNNAVFEGNDIELTREVAGTLLLGKAIIKNADGSCMLRESKLINMEQLGSEKLGWVQSPELETKSHSVDCDAPIPS